MITFEIDMWYCLKQFILINFHNNKDTIDNKISKRTIFNLYFSNCIDNKFQHENPVENDPIDQTLQKNILEFSWESCFASY